MCRKKRLFHVVLALLMLASGKNLHFHSYLLMKILVMIHINLRDLITLWSITIMHLNYKV